MQRAQAQAWARPDRATSSSFFEAWSLKFLLETFTFLLKPELGPGPLYPYYFW